MRCVIFDVDGTLMDIGHRRHHVTGGNKNWKAFNDEMINDTPFPGVCALANMLGSHPGAGDEGGFFLFVFSGRTEDKRDVTEAQLHKHVPHLMECVTAVLMRPEKDYRPDTELKREMLRSIQDQGFDVQFVVDDRPSVIAMWKSEGIQVLEVNTGEWN
jgi:phosphoglycolate phosphatase-like HAD superfamily hydrolase